MSYDPSAPGVRGSIFGLPYLESDASIVILPVPWDVTTSYSSGTSKGPQAILDASPQLDLELPELTHAWKTKIWMASISEKILKKGNDLRSEVGPYLDALEIQQKNISQFDNLVSKVNQASLDLKEEVKKQATDYLRKGKLVGVLGGDHSTPQGLIEALGEKHGSFGMLQIDAHMDLRESYERFEHSHASIMHNALKDSNINKLVQVGIRDYCPEEVEFVKESNGRVDVFYDEIIKEQLYTGTSWDTQCDNIIKCLPDQVYISFDIDGLNPSLCPGTGTPVPGGLEYQEAIYLVKKVAQAGKKIIGFDLCEVAPKMNDQEWNANVGARVLYNLCCWTHQSRSGLSS